MTVSSSCLTENALDSFHSYIHEYSFIRRISLAVEFKYIFLTFPACLLNGQAALGTACGMTQVKS